MTLRLARNPEREEKMLQNFVNLLNAELTITLVINLSVTTA